MKDWERLDRERLDRLEAVVFGDNDGLESRVEVLEADKMVEELGIEPDPEPMTCGKCGLPCGFQ